MATRQDTGSSDSKGSHEVIADGKYLRLVRRNDWECVERKGITGIVVMAALTEDNEFVLVEQFRTPLAARVIELPAGLVGDIPGEEEEAFEDAARRELVEETGYEARELRLVTAGPISPGMSSESIHLFLALGLRRVGEGGGDATEEITVHVVPLDEVERWIVNRCSEGVLADPKIYAGLYFVRSIVG
jgi:ADP-ribose pyrophosphatase